jgi:hypothetical protein
MISGNGDTSETRERRDRPMYVIRINKVDSQVFPQPYATVELHTGSERNARLDFEDFQRRFPPPAFCLCLTKTDSRTETIATSENW